MKQTKIHKSKKTGLVVHEFDTSRLRGKYYVYPECSFYQLTEEISFDGFPALPKGFFRDGYGFASPAGTFLTAALKQVFGEKIKLSVSRLGDSKVTTARGGTQVSFKFSDYMRILDPLRDIRREGNLKSKQHVASILGELFPKHAGKIPTVATIYSYEEDKITKIFGSDSGIVERLSKADIETIANIFNQLAASNETSFNSIAVAEKSKTRNERVYLQTVVEEFEKRLENEGHSESDWQRFLQKYILLFNTSYVSVIEKLSVSIRGKFPDFMLVNVFGYIDIYEIKKPSTQLLKYDQSRDNYFWDVEVAKAITQTEKYIQMLVRSGYDVREYIKQKHGTDVKIIRPRGFVVVGTSSQFKGQQMEDDFRLLASSLKNVDVVLYDELLGNLKNLLNRLEHR